MSSLLEIVAEVSTSKIVEEGEGESKTSTMTHTKYLANNFYKTVEVKQEEFLEVDNFHNLKMNKGTYVPKKSEATPGETPKGEDKKTE
jgi:phage tail tube protein FII